MPIKNYVCNSLISGVNALKNIETSKAVLATDGDRAFVVDSGQYYYFRFYATSTEAEELVVHPFVVRPDYYVDAGVWIEQSLLSTDIMAILVEVHNDMVKWENPALSLSYNNGQLVTISKVVDGVTYLKTLSYTNEVLTSISQWEAV